MKNTFQLCVLLFMVATLLSSCKEDKKEWSYMYGYNREDVLGNYTFSNIPKAYDGLEENAYCHICDSAMVSITSSGENSILFELNSPSNNVFRVFNGLPSLTPNDFMIDMIGSWTSLSSSRLRRNSVTAYVYKNDKDDRRLSGFVAENYWKVITYPDSDDKDTIFDYSVKYHFDVVRDR